MSSWANYTLSLIYLFNDADNNIQCSESSGKMSEIMYARDSVQGLAISRCSIMSDRASSPSEQGLLSFSHGAS